VCTDNLTTCYAKYVDDTTVVSVSKDVSDVTLQTAADHLVHWAQNNGMMIYTNKTKELIICFNKKVNAEDISPLCINGSNIERVNTFKLLGVFVSSDLSWDYHVMYLLRTVAKRMYCINYLFRAGVPTSDIVCVYTSIIRSVLELIQKNLISFITVEAHCSMTHLKPQKSLGFF